MTNSRKLNEMLTQNMAVFVVCIALGLPIGYGAEPVTDVVLDASTMARLGFSLESLQEEGLRFNQLTGPRDVDGCPARRAGSYLLSPSEEVVAFQSAWFEANDGAIEPVAEISFAVGSQNARLFIDYICSGSASGTRYVLVLFNSTGR